MTEHAAGPWLDIRRVSPLPGQSYLVASRQVGTVMDVAFFTGPRPGGGLWWTMSDIEFPAGAITHWAPLIEPLPPELRAKPETPSEQSS